MSDKPTAVELIGEGHAEGDRVVAMHVAWEAITTLTAERDARDKQVRELVEAARDMLEQGKHDGPCDNVVGLSDGTTTRTCFWPSPIRCIKYQQRKVCEA